MSLAAAHAHQVKATLAPPSVWLFRCGRFADARFSSGGEKVSATDFKYN